MLLSKPFNQHSGSIYLRSKFYWIVMISFDIATANYNQVWLLSAMTACVLRPTAGDRSDMHVDRKLPHLTADRPSWARLLLLKPYRLTL